MAGILLSTGAYTKTKRVVKTFDNDIRRNQGMSKRRIDNSSGGASTVVTSTPFKASLKKDSEGNQLVKIIGGAIIVEGDSSTNVIETNYVDISDYVTTGVIYVYAKIPANWRNDSGDFKLYPTLTPNTGSDISDTNFFANGTKMPANNIEYVYYPACAVSVALLESVPNYSVVQIAYDNYTLESYSDESFSSALLPYDTTDGDDPSSYYLFINGGQVKLPDSDTTFDVTEFSVLSNINSYVYLVSTATQGTYGGWSNYIPTVELLTELQTDTDAISYYLKSSVIGNNLIIGETGNFFRDGKIY